MLSSISGWLMSKQMSPESESEKCQGPDVIIVGRAQSVPHVELSAHLSISKFTYNVVFNHPLVDVLANTCNSVILPHFVSLTTTILQWPLCPSMVPAMCHAPSASLLPGLSYSHSGRPHWYLMSLWSSHPGRRTPSGPTPNSLKILVAHWLT